MSSPNGGNSAPKSESESSQKDVKTSDPKSDPLDPSDNEKNTNSDDGEEESDEAKILREKDTFERPTTYLLIHFFEDRFESDELESLLNDLKEGKRSALARMEELIRSPKLKPKNNEFDVEEIIQIFNGLFEGYKDENGLRVDCDEDCISLLEKIKLRVTKPEEKNMVEYCISLMKLPEKEGVDLDLGKIVGLNMIAANYDEENADDFFMCSDWIAESFELNEDPSDITNITIEKLKEIIDTPK